MCRSADVLDSGVADSGCATVAAVVADGIPTAEGDATTNTIAAANAVAIAVIIRLSPPICLISIFFPAVERARDALRWPG
jgi:hypothetical protein